MWCNSHYPYQRERSDRMSARLAPSSGHLPSLFVAFLSLFSSSRPSPHPVINGTLTIIMTGHLECLGLLSTLVNKREKERAKTSGQPDRG